MKEIPKSAQKKPKPTLRARLFAVAWTIFMAGLVAVGFWFLIAFMQMPSLDSILKETREPTITFVDSEGYEIRTDNRIMGTPVSVKSLPPYVWQAVVAIEDKRFFQHGAMDYQSLVRAVFTNLKAGSIAAGGSTITQQTAKNIFLSRQKKYTRKIQELILSQWLENRFDKNQILDLYLNRVVLVQNLRGIDAAARELFNKTAEDLTIAQSAQIAAMLKAPTTYSPAKHPQQNIARARLVLTEMVRQKYITLEQAQEAAAELNRTPQPASRVMYSERYWVDFVTDELHSNLPEINSDIIIYTTLDTKLQERAAAVVRKKAPPYQSAVVALSGIGAIRAMVGGADYQTSQFNRALALRQPGSAFKPVVYLAALESGMSPADKVVDSPFAIGDYNPRNYNGRYYGEITLATAFAKSVNSVPLKLTEKMGIDKVLGMAARLGVGGNLHREYSTVLGASEMSLLDLTTLNAVIWNDGFSVRPFAIEKIISTDNKVLYQRNPSAPLQLLQPSTITAMRELLGNVIKTGGTGTRAASDGVLGGKTGTSNDNRDAWFVGATNDEAENPYAENLTIGVWLGNDDNSAMDSHITGGTIPAEIFKGIVEKSPSL